IDDLRRDAVALMDAMRDRRDRNVEAINLARLDRLRLYMAVIRLHLGRLVRIERTMRRAQPALGDPIRGRVESLATVIGRLRHLLRELDEKVHVVAGR